MIHMEIQKRDRYISPSSCSTVLEDQFEALGAVEMCT